MGLIDTHTHLESFVRKGTHDAALQAARAVGVDAMITIGTSPDDWALYRDIAEVHAATGVVHYTVGLHPCAVDSEWEEAVKGIAAFFDAGRALPVALGECGLDRFHLPKQEAQAEEIFGWQRAAFAAQLKIARTLNCPVVVHSRGAFHECVEMIDASGVNWAHVVFHCFTEGEAEIGELMRRGGFGSFTGIHPYKSADAVRAAAKAQGLARFMLETDAPYLTPMPHRGKPNEPAFVRHTADYAATEVFGVSFDEVARVSSDTARAFFRL